MGTHQSDAYLVGIRTLIIEIATSSEMAKDRLFSR